MQMRMTHPMNTQTFTQVHIGGRWIAFSYETPIAFSDSNGNRVVRVNDWGPTTGKHLNYIDYSNRADRIPSADFEAALNKEWDTK